MLTANQKISGFLPASEGETVKFRQEPVTSVPGTYKFERLGPVTGLIPYTGHSTSINLTSKPVGGAQMLANQATVKTDSIGGGGDVRCTASWQFTMQLPKTVADWFTKDSISIRLEVDCIPTYGVTTIDTSHGTSFKISWDKILRGVTTVYAYNRGFSPHSWVLVDYIWSQALLAVNNYYVEIKLDFGLIGNNHGTLYSEFQVTASLFMEGSRLTVSSGDATDLVRSLDDSACSDVEDDSDYDMV